MKSNFHRNIISYLGGPMAAALMIGCAHEQDQYRTDRTESGMPRTSFAEQSEGAAISRAAAQEADAHRFTEIQFVPGSSALTVPAMENLRSAILTTDSEGGLDEVIVMAWSDEELPAQKGKSLTQGQRDLAKARAKNIETFVKRIKSVDVDTYSMAEKSSAVSNLFNTRDSRLKKTLIDAGLPTSSDTLQYPSKASHAVVMLKIE